MIDWLIEVITIITYTGMSHKWEKDVSCVDLDKTMKVDLS